MFKRQTLSKVASVTAVLWIAASSTIAQTAQQTQSYSATAIHIVPGQEETSGVVMKSGENIRLEFDQNGQRVIQILRPEVGLMYILNPAEKTYFEIRGSDIPGAANQANTAPCTEQSGLALCQQVGLDTVSGIKVERWLLASQPNTKPVAVLWDPTRRHALRQDFPDGSTTALSFVAMEDVNGRSTEHWTLQILAPGQETLTGGWWFDPEIRVVVREELPGGEVRHLENIVVGAVDPAVFQLPDGWKQQDTSTIETPMAQDNVSE